MIQERSFDDLGLPADFGYLYLHDGVPLLQLQPLDESTLIFWRGSASLALLHAYFHRIIVELSGSLNVPFYSLANAVIHYATPEKVTSLPYTLNPEYADENAMLDQHSEFMRKNLDKLVFARLDVDYKDSINLWADLDGSKDSEVGFCSVLVPDSVMALFSETSFRSINSRDLKTLFENIGLQMPMQVAEAR